MLTLKNTAGQTVRVYDTSHFADREVVTVVYRHDTRRVEPCIGASALEFFRQHEIGYDVLGETTLAKLKTQSLAIGSVGTLCTQSVIGALSPSHDLKPEADKKDLILIGKWVSGVQVAIVLLALLVSYLIVPKEAPETEVTVIRSMELETKPERPVMAPPAAVKPVAQVQPKIRNKIAVKPKPQPRVVTRHAPKMTIQRKVVTAQVPRSAPSLESLGALGALGGVSKKQQSGGGLNLSGASLARGGEQGAGGGGVGDSGKGGLSNALFGNGLVAASAGSGARAGSAGGYGTKGKGGGRQGYGDRKVVGASGGYVAPLDSESFINGGLSRAQVEEVILRNMGLITLCYEKGLQVEPSLKGRVAVSFVIGAGGQVTTARVQHSSVESRQLEGCIVGKLRQFQFPRPVAGVNVEVQYPFSFRRVSSN